VLCGESRFAGGVDPREQCDGVWRSCLPAARAGLIWKELFARSCLVRDRAPAAVGGGRQATTAPRCRAVQRQVRLPKRAGVHRLLEDRRHAPSTGMRSGSRAYAPYSILTVRSSSKTALPPLPLLWVAPTRCLLPPHPTARCPTPYAQRHSPLANM